MSVQYAQKSFSLPKKDTAFWKKQQSILLSLSKKELQANSFNELAEYLDQLRGSLMKSAMKYSNLQIVFNNFQKTEQEYFLNEFFPSLCSLILQMKQEELIILSTELGNQSRVSLTRKEISEIVGCMFLCLLKDTQTQVTKDFRQLFIRHAVHEHLNIRRQEKIKCIINYLKQAFHLTPKESQEQVVYELIEGEKINTFQQWEDTLKNLKLSSMEATHQELIENCQNTLQVDFANAQIGGGILTDGLVQEEIRFCISPELLPVTIFCSNLIQTNQVVVIRGVKQYSSYIGYSNSFRFQEQKGDKKMEIKQTRQNQNTVQTNPETILAIDAKCFSLSDDQYSESNLLRELNKAAIGFQQEKRLKTIASGRWGCGAFNGSFHLKILIQWIAASLAKKKLLLCTFEDEETAKEVNELAKQLQNTKASNVLDLIRTYSEIVSSKNKAVSSATGSTTGVDFPTQSLLEFIKNSTNQQK